MLTAINHADHAPLVPWVDGTLIFGDLADGRLSAHGVALVALAELRRNNRTCPVDGGKQ